MYVAGQFFDNFTRLTWPYFIKVVTMTVEDLKLKLVQLQRSAADDEIREAVTHMLFAVELDNAWTEEELQEYWREIELVERELATVRLLSLLEKQLN
jgi:hypothetical protein